MDFNMHYEEFELYEKGANVGHEIAFGCMEYVDYEKVSSLRSIAFLITYVMTVC